MRESQIERHLRERVEQIGGECFKFTSPGRVGVPDRIVVLPGGELTWIETKTEKGVVSSPQKRCHARLRALMQEVKVIRSVEEINTLFPIE